MSNETTFLYIIAAISLCFGLLNGIQFLLKRNKTAQTIGTIMSIKMPNPETAKHRNSKWATVSYKVNGKTYQSRHRIQVPMTSQVGSTVKVRYDKFVPEKLYSFSVLRIVVSLFIAAIFFSAAIFKLI
ncbi:DUF3592 domain-containing protein [Candidatus Ventrimonas sp. KK005]|jgi:hypothetical protein|nr:hypothetical protein [Clostridiaceae bacterium]